MLGPLRSADPVTVAPHPDVAALAFLVGTWTAEGRGQYPTIAPFDDGEEVRAWQAGTAFLASVQRTWARDDGRSLHAESGYGKVAGVGRPGRGRR